MKQIKLIAGKMNVPYVVCKPGYADGANKPKRIKKVVPFNAVIKLRKSEFKEA